MREDLAHQTLHNAVAAVFRVGAHAGNESDGVYRAVDVHFQRINGDLRYKCVVIEAAEHIGAFENREFGLFDLVVPPSGGGQFLFRDLEGVAQQGIVLLKIVGF